MPKQTKTIPCETENLSEDAIQIRIVMWLAKNNIQSHHSPNGGYRNKFEAMKLKRMGVSPGFPDIFCPIPKGKYHGFFLELKSKKGRLSDMQIEWLHRLRESGYYAEWATGFDEAIEIIKNYFSMP